ncbi:MAG: hypothetical protein QXX12_01715 [Nanopusillaceae archaeon]
MIELGFGFWMTLLGLAAGLAQGGSVTLLCLDLAFEINETELIVFIDPVFLVRGSAFRGPFGEIGHFAAFFNTIYWAEWRLESLYQDPRYSGWLPEYSLLRAKILQHELNHVRQYRAAGPLFPIIQIAVNWEGYFDPFLVADMGTYMDVRNRNMWKPPDGMRLGSFLIYYYFRH